MEIQIRRRIRIRQILIESFPSYRYIDLHALPEDLQVLIADLFGDELVMEPPQKLPIIDMALENLPVLPLSKNDRGEMHLQKMIGQKLPLIIVSNNKIIDGRHRIHAAKRENKKTIQAIDLTSFGIKTHWIKNTDF